MSKMIRHGSLFSGIGGFDLAAEMCGWKNVFNCEIDMFCRQVLGYHFPKAKSYEDIRKTDFSRYRGKIEVLTGGFPCQPFSVAGKRLGKEDERHLWPQMLRAIREIQPDWVVAENVLGITSWNGGMVFEEVWSELEAEGYQVQPYVLPAAGVGAPHRRDRVWFVACKSYKGKGSFRRPALPENIRGAKDLAGIIADAARLGRDSRGNSGKTGPVPGNSDRDAQKDKPERDIRKCGPGAADATNDPWQHWPSQPPVCYPNDGLSYPVDANTIFEGIPFPEKPITFSRWRTESIKAMGNAIVPQVALQIFRTIQLMLDLKLC